MRLRRPAALLGVLVAGVVVTGCGGSSAPAAAPTAPRVTTPPPCPTPSTHPTARWPASVPADLPKPPDATITDTQSGSGGVHIVKFTTPTSLRESVLFVVERLPRAGYVLGRGDAEAVEADAPFLHNDVRGLIRMIEVGACTTQWLLATVDTSAPTGGSPLLPTHSPSTSPSPLPFG